MNWANCWQVYQRLQELDIPPIYETNRPLTNYLPKILVRQK
jgi:hypothetical protein